MMLNLVQHRGEASVWEGKGRLTADPERWVAAVVSGALLALGFRRRSPAGLLFVLGGSTLAWWASTGVEERRRRRGRLLAVWPRRAGSDPVAEASEESFPASDPPSWTPTTAARPDGDSPASM